MKYLFVFILPLLQSFNASAQLDSAAIVSVVESTISTSDSLGYQMSSIEVQIFVNDFDFLGEIVITVVESESGYPLGMIKKSKVEIEQNNGFNSQTGVVSLALEVYNTQNGKNLRAVVRNYQGASLPYLDSSL
jgi:hypothetical protein